MKKREKKKHKGLGNRITDIIVIILLIIFCIWQDNDISVTSQSYNSNKIPNAFNGFKIVQISDLHNTSFGKNNSR